MGKLKRQWAEIIWPTALNNENVPPHKVRGT
jgi:hypothetical protein